MTEHTHVPERQEETDLLRDQFRQLLRYRALIVVGLVLGLLGGAYVALAGRDTYVGTSEVMVRSPTVDPFAAGGVAADKQINIGTERQTAASGAVASRAAEALGRAGDGSRLQADLQVTNPANTLVLRFAYTGDSPRAAARGATAFAEAYLDYRQEQTKSLIKNMIAGYREQLDPLAKQREDLLRQVRTIQDDTAKSTVLTAQANLLGQISQLSNDISQLKSLDTTPGYVIRTATPPDAPEGLGLPMLLALGAAVGLAVGLLVAWVRLVFDPAARSDGDVARALRAPVLGSLPRTRPGPLLATDHADARLAEQYRSVAFRLAYDQRFADRRRLLVVAPRGEGDTAEAVAVNLSASFAETGMETLLIEADLRSSGIAARLRADDGSRPAWAQSADVGEAGWPAGIRVSVDAGESGSFDLVPGRPVPNVARALTSSATSRLIAEADAPGSIVVVIAPPVLSYADALALVDRVDGVVVVCDPREVRRADLDRIRELIDGAGGSVLGAVLHGTPRRALTGRTGRSGRTAGQRSGAGHRARATAGPGGRSGGRSGGGSGGRRSAGSPDNPANGPANGPGKEPVDDPADTLALHTVRSAPQ